MKKGMYFTMIPKVMINTRRVEKVKKVIGKRKKTALMKMAVMPKILIGFLTILFTTQNKI